MPCINLTNAVAAILTCKIETNAWLLGNLTRKISFHILILFCKFLERNYVKLETIFLLSESRSDNVVRDV